VHDGEGSDVLKASVCMYVCIHTYVYTCIRVYVCMCVLLRISVFEVHSAGWRGLRGDLPKAGVCIEALALVPDGTSR